MALCAGPRRVPAVGEPRVHPSPERRQRRRVRTLVQRRDDRGDHVGGRAHHRGGHPRVAFGHPRIHRRGRLRRAHAVLRRARPQPLRPGRRPGRRGGPLLSRRAPPACRRRQPRSRVRPQAHARPCSCRWCSCSQERRRAVLVLIAGFALAAALPFVPFVVHDPGSAATPFTYHARRPAAARERPRHALGGCDARRCGSSAHRLGVRLAELLERRRPTSWPRRPRGCWHSAVAAVYALRLAEAARAESVARTRACGRARRTAGRHLHEQGPLSAVPDLDLPGRRALRRTASLAAAPRRRQRSLWPPPSPRSSSPRATGAWSPWTTVHWRSCSSGT